MAAVAGEVQRCRGAAAAVMDESGRRTLVRCHIRMSQFVVALHGMNSSWPKPFLHSMLSNKGLVLHSLRPSNAR